MNMIKKSFSRPDAKLIEKFNNIPTPILSDVMGRHGCMDNRIRPVYQKAHCVGPALTVRTYPSDNLMMHVALKLAAKGDILVVDAGGYPNAGLWGELMTIAAQLKGIKGLIIDGGIRDCAEIEQHDFPVFCVGINARGGFKNNPGSLNCPISCGGIAVNPGDIIVADENGVIVIPQENASEILEKSILKMQAEQDLINKMQQGIELFDLLELDKTLTKLNITIVDN